MWAIEIVDLHKTYRGKKFKRVEALKGLNLCVPTGEVFGFLGPNGAGKSTTIKAIMGLIYPTSGTVKLAGLCSDDAKARASVGYLPENPVFFDYLTGDEYLGFVGTTYRMKSTELQRRKQQVLERLDLWSARKRPVRGYSKGMVQRLGLAQALLHDPDIYILDEPMSGLDPVGRALVKDIILELRQRKKTVFFSTHITADVELLCDRIAVLDRGCLMTSCRVDEIVTGSASSDEYRVRFSEHGSNTVAEEHVAASHLSAWIASAQDEQRVIISIAAKRQTLEDFFLQTVNHNG